MFTKSSLDGGFTDEVLYGMHVTALEHCDETKRTLIRTHYRYEGWIADEDLTPVTQEILEWEQAAQHLIANFYSDILSEPRIQALPLISLTRGARIQVLTEKDEAGWVKVRLFDGREGYVRENKLMPYIAPWEWNREDPSQNPISEEELRRNIVETAKAFLGAQYRWGGKSPMGIDCSGLCSSAYMQNGILIYRDASLREEFPIHPIEQSEMKMGDLYYFPGHIAMYIDEDHFIHSTSMGGYYGVVINSFNPEHPHYRPDLKAKIKACGSLF